MSVRITSRRRTGTTFAAVCLGLLLATPAAFAQSTAEATTPPLTDANIAAIVVAANTADIENGQLAKSKAQHADVKQFAETMITDHTAVNKQATDLATKLKLTPAQNDASRNLTTNADKTRKELATKSGKAFDKAYIDNEVAYHQSVLETIDKALIPNAANADLKMLIEKVRPVIAAHLEHAKKIQASLAG
jgi:putative membrane protein